jgi:hypothetical protein
MVFCSLYCKRSESLGSAKIFTADGANGEDNGNTEGSVQSFHPRNPRNPRFNSFWLRLRGAGFYVVNLECRACGSKSARSADATTSQHCQTLPGFANGRADFTIQNSLFTIHCSLAR